VVSQADEGIAELATRQSRVERDRRNFDEAAMENGAVEGIVSILERFPLRELDIRRRCGGDAEFRAICDDYEIAARALLRWQEKGEAGSRQVADYGALLDELEREILTLLGPDRPTTGPHEFRGRAKG
jgi:hypothetical protein